MQIEKKCGLGFIIGKREQTRQIPAYRYREPTYDNITSKTIINDILHHMHYDRKDTSNTIIRALSLLANTLHVSRHAIPSGALTDRQVFHSARERVSRIDPYVYDDVRADFIRIRAKWVISGVKFDDTIVSDITGSYALTDSCRLSCPDETI